MGFYQTHSGWTYVQHRLLMSTTSYRTIARYYNDTGSTKKISSITFEKMGVANGRVYNDIGGNALNCTGEATEVYLTVNGKNSNTQIVSNKCNPKRFTSGGQIGTYYDLNACTSYTFTFNDATEISAGATVDILITVSGADATNRGMVINRNNNNTSLYISGVVTDPYKTPTCEITNNNVKISHHNTSRSIYVKGNESGDNASTTVKVTVNGNEETTSFGNNGGNYNFTPINKNVGEGSSYKVKARRIHNSNNSLYCDSNELTLYTYRIPSISNVRVANSIISGNKNNTLSWVTNGRRWEDDSLEQIYKTYISINNGSSYFESSNNNPTGNQTNSSQSITITPNILNSYLTTSQRSQSSINTKIKVKRTNPSSGKEAISGEINLTIQYKPKYSPENLYFYKYDTSKTDNKGTMLTARKYVLYR